MGMQGVVNRAGVHGSGRTAVAAVWRTCACTVCMYSACSRCDPCSSEGSVQWHVEGRACGAAGGAGVRACLDVGEVQQLQAAVEARLRHQPVQQRLGDVRGGLLRCRRRLQRRPLRRDAAVAAVRRRVLHSPVLCSCAAHSMINVPPRGGGGIAACCGGGVRRCQGACEVPGGWDCGRQAAQMSRAWRVESLWEGARE